MHGGNRRARTFYLAIVLIGLAFATTVLMVQSSFIQPSDIQYFDSPSLLDAEGDEVGASYHVPFFILTGLLGVTAFISGMKNSKSKGVRELIPFDIPRKLHRYVSVAYYAVYLGTFALWSLQYYVAKGRIFHTTHGIVGLTSVLFAVLSIITGIAMFYRPKKWRETHWAFNIGTLVLLFIAMLMGLGLDD